MFQAHFSLLPCFQQNQAASFSKQALINPLFSIPAQPQTADGPSQWLHNGYKLQMFFSVVGGDQNEP